MKKQKKQNINLDTILDDALMDIPISQLPVQIKGTWLEECIQQLYEELTEKGIVFKPECYLADEWLTPEKETCIGIPFYLAHPTLIRLEKKFMMDAEGEGKPWCMKLLRHEAGHALCYAYGFHKRKKWQRTFGPSTLEYKDTYKSRPYSKNYVRHLDGYYAQYHPEEDFVETFAVWLTPGLDWREKYKGWKALAKLEYVDRLMKEIHGRQPRRKSSEKFWRLATLRMTLRNYYKKKHQFWLEELPDFHDGFLRKNFTERGEVSKKGVSLTEILRKYQRNIIHSISRQSGEKQYVIGDLLKDIHKRSKELKLVTLDDEIIVVLNLTSYATSLIMNYLYTGRFRGERKKKKK